MSRLTRLIDTITGHSEYIGEVLFALCRVGIPMVFGFAAFGCAMHGVLSLLHLPQVSDLSSLFALLLRIAISVYGFFVLRNVAYRFLEEAENKRDIKSD